MGGTSRPLTRNDYRIGRKAQHHYRGITSIEIDYIFSRLHYVYANIYTQ